MKAMALALTVVLAASLGANPAWAEDVDVFLKGGEDGGAGGLPEAGVDDLHAGIAQVTDDQLGTTVVAVETDFGNQNAGRAIHAVSVSKAGAKWAAERHLAACG